MGSLNFFCVSTAAHWVSLFMNMMQQIGIYFIQKMAINPVVSVHIEGNLIF